MISSEAAIETPVVESVAAVEVTTTDADTEIEDVPTPPRGPTGIQSDLDKLQLVEVSVFSTTYNQILDPDQNGSFSTDRFNYLLASAVLNATLRDDLSTFEALKTVSQSHYTFTLGDDDDQQIQVILQNDTFVKMLDISLPNGDILRFVPSAGDTDFTNAIGEPLTAEAYEVALKVYEYLGLNWGLPSTSEM